MSASAMTCVGWREAQGEKAEGEVYEADPEEGSDAARNFVAWRDEARRKARTRTRASEQKEDVSDPGSA